MTGLRLALSWLSVLPVQAENVDVDTCRSAIRWAPAVGALLGAVASAVLFALGSLGASPPLAGLVTLAVSVLLTRAMHVDGLADTVDGLGCYGPPERALQVMRDGGAGPFAVAALVVALGAQAVSLAALWEQGRWLAVPLAYACGRAAFLVCCRRGVPAARSEGMGALVAGSQGRVAVGSWWAGLTLVSAFAAPGVWWLGPAGVLLAGGVVWALRDHVTRRIGGTTGDVLGGSAELATAVVLAVCSFG